MAKECYAPCGRKLIDLTPREAGAFIRHEGGIQRWPQLVIEQKVKEAEVGGFVLQQYPGPDVAMSSIRYLNNLGIAVTEGNVDCPSYCGNSTYCSKAVL